MNCINYYLQFVVPKLHVVGNLVYQAQSSLAFLTKEILIRSRVCGETGTSLSLIFVAVGELWRNNKS
ncbi:hypothetical protein A4A49_18151 [Nicotiana attenuata]|uniref:Uncharacterized protein n=1 Tax=Nicotiana attenuata TaxID=49451 RepID=A0A314LC19_NICAT|nr:hypothetical protein A4A49_18151 [Nicotiana attenuata]